MSKTEESTMVTCEKFGNRCNICGSYFAELDDICGGGHQIGEQYPVPVPEKK